MRKTAFCICKNKDTDQLRGNRKADQRLCFRYSDSSIPLLPKSEISSLWPSSVAVQPGLCRTWSETPKTGFLTTRLKLPRGALIRVCVVNRANTVLHLGSSRAMQKIKAFSTAYSSLPSSRSVFLESAIFRRCVRI